jgi:hypothetical protein
MNIALITFDSLRYDTAMDANTPHCRELFGADTWHKVYTNATFTLPAHIAILQSGVLPSTYDPSEPGPYNRQKELIFRPTLPWNRNKPARYPTPEAANIVRGFAKLGYRTVGLAGVHWFNTQFETSAFWRGGYFEEFYWEDQFSENSPEAFENQIRFARTLNLRGSQRLFFFMNVATPHTPYRNLPPRRTSQIQCFEYVDTHLPALLALLPRPCHLLMMADHGECFEELDGRRGHGFYHPKVMEVPMISLILP